MNIVDFIFFSMGMVIFIFVVYGVTRLLCIGCGKEEGMKPEQLKENDKNDGNSQS